MAVEKGQIDLFAGVFGDEAVTEETGKDTKTSTSKTKKTAAKGKTTTKTPVKPEPKPPMLINGDWKADFYGNVFEVSDYLEEIPEEGVEVEELRKEMEKDFFGLSKERAHWEIDEENKRIFFFQKGTSKGAL